MTATIEAAPIVAPKRSLKVPIALSAVVVLLAALLVLVPRAGSSSFDFSDRSGTGLPELTVPTMPAAWVIVIVLAALSGVSWWFNSMQRRSGMWLPVVFGILAVFGFLIWASAGGRVPVEGLLFGSISLAVPLVFGALGGVVGERVGVVNVGIEAQFLLAAFSAAVVASVTGNAFIGLIGAMAAGILVSLVLAVFAIKYIVEQVIVGVVLNVLVQGLTTFLLDGWLQNDEQLLNRPPRFQPVLAWFAGLFEGVPAVHDVILAPTKIPIIGPVVFGQNFLVYVAVAAVILVSWGLYRTRWGLRLRAVGEHPQAADTVGINVNRTRYRNLMLAGALAGLGGAYFTLVSVGPFSKEMTNGAGFIALAAVIFGRWDPVRATMAALLFGFAMMLKNTMQAVGSPVPQEFMMMLPYVVTVLAVAGFVGQIRGPAAVGKPYIKG